METSNKLQERYEQIDTVLGELDCEASAAEIHGITSGLVAGGLRDTPVAWYDLIALHLDFERDLSEDDKSLLLELYSVVYDEITDASLNFGFQLLQPDDDYPLLDRLCALVDWCRGFAEGLGLSQVAELLEQDKESRELLQDIVAIAQMDTEADAAPGLEQESQYMELVEYARVCCMNLYSNLGLKKLADTSLPANGDVLH